MGILDWGLGTDEQYNECRQCGQSVDDPEEPCPFCGCTDIAVYDF